MSTESLANLLMRELHPPLRRGQKEPSGDFPYLFYTPEEREHYREVAALVLELYGEKKVVVACP